MLRRCLLHVRFFASQERNVVDMFEKVLTDNTKAAGIKSAKKLTLSEKTSPTADSLPRKSKKKRIVRKHNEKFVFNEDGAFSRFRSLPTPLKVRLNQNFKEILPIQQKVLPLALKNRNLLFQSETGSGKTLAYTIPLLDKLFKDKINKNKCGVVIVPTKLLADQIYRVVLEYTANPLDVLVLKKDNSKKYRTMLCDGIPIIIATPGHFNIALKLGFINAEKVRMMVMDEVDRLYDEDFREQTEHLIASFSRRNQNKLPVQFLLSSATVPREMKLSLTEYLPNLEALTTASITPVTITHTCIVAPSNRKTETVVEVLRSRTNLDGTPLRTIVFVQKKEICDSLTQVLVDAGFYTTTVHGDMSADGRHKALRDFRENYYDILVTTDVIARGIDVPDCEQIIQIQPRVDSDMFFHRAGRCGRAGRTGRNVIITSDGNPYDRDMVNSVRNTVDMEIIDATSFLPLVPDTSLTSELDWSADSVTEELSFTVEITPVAEIPFYHEIISGLGMRPIQVESDETAKTLSLWFGSPTDAWGARTALRHYFSSHNLPEHVMHVFRHQHRPRWTLDWDAYFDEIRQRRADARKESYKNFVKAQMGRKAMFRKYGR